MADVADLSTADVEDATDPSGVQNVGERSAEQPVSLAELDARHDDVLRQLEELDQQIQAVLKEHLPQKATPPPSPIDEHEPAPSISLPLSRSPLKRAS